MRIGRSAGVEEYAAVQEECRPQCTVCGRVRRSVTGGYAAAV